MVDSLVAGNNVHVIAMGHHRGGHTALVNAIAPQLIDSIFDHMQQRQAVAGGQDTRLSFQLTARMACAVIGSPDRMTDLLSPGSSELRIVRDADATAGVQLAGLRNHPIAQSADFMKVFKGARTRLAQQHKPPAPSSLLWLELVQTSQRAGAADDELVSQLVLADIEVANLGDGLAAALRSLLCTPPARQPPTSGAALLLGDALGGNSRAVLLGCVLPTDAEECVHRVPTNCTHASKL